MGFLFLPACRPFCWRAALPLLVCLFYTSSATSLDCQKYENIADRRDGYEAIPSSLSFEIGGVLPPFPACDSPSDNIRGSYTPRKLECTISFHQQIQQEATNDFQLSTGCTDANNLYPGRLLSVYVGGVWPDECVGDFGRCYSVERDETVFARLFCEEDWAVPESATHIRVDCTADKQTLIADRTSFEDYDRISWERRQMWFAEASYLTAIVVATLVCLLCLCGVHYWVVLPRVKAMRESTTVQESEQLVGGNEQDISETVLT